MKRFGVQSENSCEFYLKELLNMDEELNPEQLNYMYELYLPDKNGKLIDIPVVLNQTGTLSSDPSDDWKLYKRFFVIDTLTGNVKDSNAEPEYVRFASDIKLKVQMDPDRDETIYRPYLILQYKEIASKYISDSTYL